MGRDMLFPIRQPAGDWLSHRACADVPVAVFYSVSNKGAREARAICEGCAVRAECLEYALDNKEREGVWGGKSERQRRALRIGRPRLQAAICGTEAGYKRHKRHDEPPCTPCFLAKAEHQRLGRVAS